MSRTLFVVLALCVLACRGSEAPRDAALPAPGALRGSFQLTYYWISSQRPGDRGKTTLYRRDCEPIATVSNAFADELAMSGTGRLQDGRVLGIVSDCKCPHSPCVRVLPQEELWGVGQDNRPLVPFLSLAVDRKLVPIGTRLYIEELDGVQLIPSFPTYHDGCVIADDTGERIVGEHLDWFVGVRDRYVELDKRLDLQRVTVHDGGERCW
jgi:3D (Asp-Asp-Asp) domain-containing protein